MKLLGQRRKLYYYSNSNSQISTFLHQFLEPQFCRESSLCQSPDNFAYVHRSMEARVNYRWTCALVEGPMILPEPVIWPLLFGAVLGDKGHRADTMLIFLFLLMYRINCLNLPGLAVHLPAQTI